jgi:AcrR family transcriptional regulator
MPASAPSHARPAKQERSLRSLERLVSAAETVLARDGWQSFTMASVAEEAGVSIGGIYRRFENKEQLLRAIKDHVLARADAEHQRIADTASTRNLAGAISHYVVNRIASLRGYSDIMRQVFEGQQSDPVMEERGRKSINVGMRVFRSVLSPHRGEIRHKDPELAIETAFFIMNATFMRRVRSPVSDINFDHIDWKHLQAEMLDMLNLYLKGIAARR